MRTGRCLWKALPCGCNTEPEEVSRVLSYYMCVCLHVCLFVCACVNIKPGCASDNDVGG